MELKYWIPFVPIVVLILFVATRKTTEEDRQLGVLDRFAKRWGLQTVRAIPPDLIRVVRKMTDGEVVRHLQLHKNVAYLTFVGPSALESTQSFHVVMKLEEVAPIFFLRPVPVIEGQKQRPKTAIVFQKDPAFTEEFVVEGPNPKAIGRFLDPELRDELYEFPKAFLRAEGRAMVLSFYGTADERDLELLLTKTADVLWAAHGAKADRALLPDKPVYDEATAKKKPAKKPVKVALAKPI